MRISNFQISNSLVVPRTTQFVDQNQSKSKGMAFCAHFLPVRWHRRFMIPIGQQTAFDTFLVRSRVRSSSSSKMALLARSLRSAFTTGIQVARKSWTQPAVVGIQHQLAYHNNGYSSISHANTFITNQVCCFSN